jgi:phage-related protein
MTQFLSWLFIQAANVYQWFGSNFWAYLTVINHTWEWIVDQAQKAYNNAISWAWEHILDFAQDIENLFDWVDYQIRQIKSGLLEDITGLMDWIQYQLDSIPQIDLQWVYDLIDGVIQYVQSIPGEIVDWVNDQVNSAKEWVNDNYGWLFETYQYFMDVLSSLPSDLFAQMRSFFDNEYIQILDFIRNPVSWILDMLWPYFIAFFCYVMAHGLGSVRYDIPYNPPWKE